MNHKPILCCGTQAGEILVYYIDWDTSDPNYGYNLKKSIENKNSELVASGKAPIEHEYQ
jgi:hypothetical protein